MAKKAAPKKKPAEPATTPATAASDAPAASDAARATVCGRFDFVRFDDVRKQKAEILKNSFVGLESLVDGAIANNRYTARAKARLMTALEDAWTQVGKALRDEQVAETGAVDLQEERTDA